MKKIFLLLFLFFSIVTLTAQNKDNYSVLVAKASLLHLQKNYNEAIVYYEKAFKIQQPDALTAYKAAGVYALANYQDKAFHYLQKALDLGWTEAD